MKHVIENVYVEIPKVNLDSVIVSNEEVHEDIDNDYRDEERKSWEAETRWSFPSS